MFGFPVSNCIVSQNILYRKGKEKGKILEIICQFFWNTLKQFSFTQFENVVYEQIQYLKLSFDFNNIYPSITSKFGNA